MSTRTSKILPLLAGLLVLAIVFAGWSALRKNAATDTGVPSKDAVREPAIAHVDPPAPIVTPPEVAQQDRTTETAPTIGQKERSIVPTNNDLELADAIWICGRLSFPQGTPVGETVDIIGHGRDFKSRELHRARVKPNGDFRVAVAPKTRAATLEIDARHLFLSKPVSVKLKDGKAASEIVLEPELGGCFQVQLHVPPQGTSLAPNLVGLSVSSWGRSDTDRESVNRTSKFDKELRAELRGLDPKLEYTVDCNPGFFGHVWLEKLRLEPGVTRQLDVDLTLGVRLLGQVVIPGKNRPENVLVRVDSTHESTAQDRINGGSNEMTNSIILHIKSDDTFDARGIIPGRISLHASATQRSPADLEVGALSDGDVREGLKLELELGGQIGGHVTWPDEAPVVGAAIELVRTGEKIDRNRFIGLGLDGSVSNDISYAVTDAEGSFLISGLTNGPFALVAQAQPREAGAKRKSSASTWKARIESVAVGSLELKVALLGGHSILGIVVDDVGAPIEHCQVAATPEADLGTDATKEIVVSSSSKNGQFELGGLLEGAYSLQANAMRHEPSEPVVVRVPANGGPLTLVAARRSALVGVVQFPDGRPAARAKLYVASADRTVRWEESVKSTDANGEFNLTSVHAGPLELCAKTDGFASSAALKLNPAPGESIEGLRLVLRNGAKLHVEVRPSRAGETVSNRWVHAFDSEGPDYSGKTDDRGRITFENVEPGEFTVQLEPSDTAPHGCSSAPGKDPPLEQLPDLPAPALDTERHRWRGPLLSVGPAAHVVSVADPDGELSCQPAPKLCCRPSLAHQARDVVAHSRQRVVDRPQRIAHVAAPG